MSGDMLRGDLGEFESGRRVKLQVDRERRDAAMLNHSATHILHYALREVLGERSIRRARWSSPTGCASTSPIRGAMAEGDLVTIEEEINARIRENAAVTIEEMAYDDAIKAGALAFFGDKYGDRVRVVRMGDFSVELCGGTHIERTGDIGVFKLEAESGVAAGVRRIEAFTGQGAIEAIRRREQILADIGDHLGARDAQALERLQRLVAREKELEKKLRALEQKLVAGDGAAAGDAETMRERQRRQNGDAQGRGSRSRGAARDGGPAAPEASARRWLRSARMLRRQGRAAGRGHADDLDRTNQGGRYDQEDRADRRRLGRRASRLRAGRRTRSGRSLTRRSGRIADCDGMSPDMRFNSALESGVTTAAL